MGRLGFYLTAQYFDSRGQDEQASLRLQLTLVPEHMGRAVGSGEDWVAPAPRQYAYTGPAVAVPAPPAASPVSPDIPPHLPAPIPNPSPDHQQIHLTQQEWKELIKGRWDSSRKAKGKKFFKRHCQAEFHVEGDQFTYRVDDKGKVVAVFDTQKCYNVTGTKNGLKGIPLTITGQPTYAGTKHLYPVTGNQRNIVVIDMAGKRPGDFKAANKAAGLAGVVAAQGRKPDKPPKGYTWHHRDDFTPNTNPPPVGTCTMELVKTKAHKATIVHYGACDQVNKHVGKKLYK